MAIWRGSKKPLIKKEVIIIVRVECLYSIHKTNSNYIESKNEKFEVFRSRYKK